MKNTIILLSVVFICFGCEKKEKQNSKNMDNNIIIGNANEEPVANKVYTLQEQIKNYDDKYILMFQEEGNFTNSGNTEILAFYQAKSVYFSNEITLKGIDKVYCFICDNSQIIKTIYLEGYGTLVDSELFKLPMDALGREIRWLDNRFGYIGDFNENKKEELYFYEGLGMGNFPAFYEFQEDNFMNILDYASYSLGFSYIFLNLVNVDIERKILTFEGSGDGNRGHASFIWNKDNQIYEKMDNSVSDLYSNPVVNEVIQD